MGYTSSPLLLISLTAAFSSQSYCYLIVVLGNLCERSNPLSAAHEGKGAFFHLMLGSLAFFHLMLIRQGNALLWDPCPCTAARYPAVGSDNLHLLTLEWTLGYTGFYVS